ncbi:hypothetical protein IFM89_012585 [Coptis chinensis]|uniref:SUEL-type lectin domain-containing protein n=1 Tax=Coptis chinensis TaxID=261450 RepID=A0A835H2S0_9MAGN|nr:hypothetical protein IFM89_012585 [Coptis chinensis]
MMKFFEHVGSQRSEMKMVPLDGGFSWKSYNEEHVPYDDNSNTVIGLLEQINITRDASDYLWYSTDVKIDPDEAFLNNEQYHVLMVLSAGHALHVFLNGQLSGKQEADSLDFYPQIGLEGEVLSLHSLSGSSSVEWVQGSFVAQKQPLTWYKTTFNLTYGNDPLALDMGRMGKGQVWINERALAHRACIQTIRYHVPAMVNPSGNLLVIFEEWGGDPNGISLKISSIKFASFGTPQGVCGSFKEGSCHAHKSYDAFEKVKPLKHSSDLPPPETKGRTYICSCTIFLHPTSGAKQVMKKWIEELQGQPWSRKAKSNNQPAFNWALNKTAGQHCDGTEKEMGHRVS